MEQIEVISWKTLDAIRQPARIIETIGNLESNEQMAVVCAIEEDFFELFYSELESNYIRHFEDEEELYKYLDIRKNESADFGYDSGDYYGDDITYEELESDYIDYRTKDDDDGSDN